MSETRTGPLLPLATESPEEETEGDPTERIEHTNFPKNKQEKNETHSKTDDIASDCHFGQRGQEGAEEESSSCVSCGADVRSPSSYGPVHEGVGADVEGA